MLGLGFLARQLGNLGGAIKGGFQGMQRMGQARQQGGGMDQFRTPGINPNAEGGGGLPLSGIAAKVANKLGIGGGGIGLKTDTDILPGINAGVDLPFTGPKKLALIPSGFFLTDLNLFFDAGLGWFTSADLKKQNPDDPFAPIQHKPLLSTGISLRLNLFGALILEPYYALPLSVDADKRSWQFGLNIVPGW
ncbi:MAG TPA: hypothetical protein PLQ88_20385 [Blastocatellia bacterium]|nr:hypothetical protein [Blastocatellia bacterium]